MKHSKIALCIISALTLSSGSLNAADFSAGPALGSDGIGAFISVAPDWQMGNGVIQVRLAGSKASSDSDITLNSIKYEGEIDFSSIKLGLDWYPSSSGQFFVSAGVVDFDRNLDISTKSNSSFKVGDQQVVASDNLRLRTDIGHSSIAPYLSIGWGNRHKGEAGFSFIAEAGAMFPVDDSEVDISVTGNTTLISQADLDKHRTQIEDDFDDPQLTLIIGVGYHF